MIHSKHIDRKLQILEETANFYNVNNRCVNALKSCVYFDPIRPYGCAVGRLVSEDLRKAIQAKVEGTFNTSVSHIFNDLPQDVQELGTPFLCQLQIFHDRPECWGPDGPSEYGKAILKTIIKDVRTCEI